MPEIAGSYNWGHHWATRLYLNAMTRMPMPFDVLADGEMKPEILSQYKCLILPHANCLLKSHDDAIKEASRAGAQVFLDAHGEELKGRFENSILHNGRYTHINTPGTLLDPFLGWYTNAVQAWVKDLSAAGSHDGAGGWTFSKELDGVTYVIVVNNLRREDGSVLTAAKTDKWYQPCGKAQKIATRFVFPKNGAVYAFNVCGRGGRVEGGRNNGGLTVSSLFDASEGRIYCVYPLALKDLQAKIADKPGKWTARLCDLTTGFTAEAAFAL